MISNFVEVCAYSLIHNFLFLISVHGNWGEWREVGACSVTCGGGKQKRVRTCDNPKPENGGNDCQGSDMEEADCNKQSCPMGEVSDSECEI